MMYDRSNEESLWPQMLTGARCGARDGMALPFLPVIEIRWDGWQ